MVLDYAQKVGEYNSGATSVSTSGARPFLVPTWYSIPVGHPDDGKLHAGCDIFAAVVQPGSLAVTTPGTITDTKGNTWTLVTSEHVNTSGNIHRLSLFHCKVTTTILPGTDTWTFTAHADATSRTTLVGLLAFRGAQAAKADVIAQLLQGEGETTAVSLGTFQRPTNPATGTVDGVPQIALFVGIGSAVAYSPGAAGSEELDIRSSSRGLAIESLSLGPGSPVNTTMQGTLASTTSWTAIGIAVRPAYAPQPPVADAGRDRVVKAGRQALLDARRTTHSASFAAPGKGPTGVTYAWAQVGGPSVGAITPGPQAGRVAFYTPPAAAAGTELTFELTVTHSSGGVDVDQVVHTLGPVAPRVDLSLGDLPPTTVELGTGSGPTPTLDDPLLYLDGVTISWRYSAPEQVVRQIEPMVAKVQLSTPDVSHLWGLESGLPAFVRVFDEYGDHVASVHGRLGELTAAQALYKRKGQPKQLRTVVQIDVVDHLGTEGDVIEEAVTVEQRWGNYWYQLVQLTDVELDFPVSWFDPDPIVSVVGKKRAVTIQNQAVVDHFRACLFECPLSTTTLPGSSEDTIYIGHYLLLPISKTGDGTSWGEFGATGDGSLDHLSLHVVPGIESPIGHNYFPARNLVEPDPDHPHVIPASKVDLSGTYRQQTNRRPNAVTVKLRNHTDTADVVTTVKATPGRRNRVTRMLDAALSCLPAVGQISATYGAPIARMHLPEQDVPPNGWDRDGFRYRPDSFDELTGGRNGDWYAGEHFGRINAFGPLGGAWFPDLRRWDNPDQDPNTGSGGELQDEDARGSWDRSTQNERLFELAPECFLVPVVVDGIPPHGSLARWDGRYVGHLSAATLTIEDGRPVVDFELVQTEPEPSLPEPTIDPETRMS